MGLNLSLEDFLAVVGSTTFIVGLVGYALSVPYRSAIENGIRNSFDAKIEKLKGEIRKDEEAFKAEIKRKDDEISSLRANVLSVVSNRHQYLDKRKLEAIEKLWSAVIADSKYTMLIEFCKVSYIDKMIEVASKGGRDSDGLKEFAKQIWEATGLEGQKYDPLADCERLYISPTAWALFVLYRNISHYAVVKFASLRGGVPDMVKDDNHIVDSLIKLLPSREEYSKEHRMTAAFYLWSEIRELIFQELVKSVDGDAVTSAAFRQSAEIVKALGASTAADLNHMGNVSLPANLAKNFGKTD